MANARISEEKDIQSLLKGYLKSLRADIVTNVAELNLPYESKVRFICNRKLDEKKIIELYNKGQPFYLIPLQYPPKKHEVGYASYIAIKTEIDKLMRNYKDVKELSALLKQKSNQFEEKFNAWKAKHPPSYVFFLDTKEAILAEKISLLLNKDQSPTPSPSPEQESPPSPSESEWVMVL